MGGDDYSNRLTDWKPLAQRMIEMLRELEWSGLDAMERPTRCPLCWARNGNDHAPDCRLAKLLQELPK